MQIYDSFLIEKLIYKISYLFWKSARGKMLQSPVYLLDSKHTIKKDCGNLKNLLSSVLQFAFLVVAGDDDDELFTKLNFDLYCVLINNKQT